MNQDQIFETGLYSTMLNPVASGQMMSGMVRNPGKGCQTWTSWLWVWVLLPLFWFSFFWVEALGLMKMVMVTKSHLGLQRQLGQLVQQVGLVELQLLLPVKQVVAYPDWTVVRSAETQAVLPVWEKESV